jgi:hypothetical protein
VGFVVDKVALGQVSSEYFGFPCQYSFHQFLHNHHLGLVQYASSGRSTQSPNAQIKKKKKTNCCIYRVFRALADWTFILPSELPAKELRHLPR